MDKIADISLFENMVNHSGSSVIHNADEAGSRRFVQARPDIEFGWKHRWSVDEKGQVGVYGDENVASLGTLVKRNMGQVFANLKNAIMGYNRAAAAFTQNTKMLQREFSVADNNYVAGILKNVRGFQAAAQAMLHQFNINMPTAR